MLVCPPRGCVVAAYAQTSVNAHVQCELATIEELALSMLWVCVMG